MPQLRPDHLSPARAKAEPIQILRAVAAIAVVLAHSFDLIENYATPRQAHFFFFENAGACGVDIFFAISGFILSTVVLRGIRRVDAGDFLLRRFVRVLPIYWIITTLLVIKHPIGITHIFTSYLLLPGWEYPMREPVLYLGWTLVFELFFYYCLALNLLRGSRTAVQRTMLLITLLVGAGLVFGTHHPLMVLIANPINLEFVAGGYIALRYHHRKSDRLVGWTLIGLATAGLVDTVFFGYHHIDESNTILAAADTWYRLLRWGVPAAMLVAGASALGGTVKGRFARLWVYLGDSSYSIYLFSVPSFYLLSLFYRRHHPAHPDVDLYLNVLFAVAAGTLFYRWVEKPLTRWLTSFFDAPAVQSAP